jgi:hypothetical protein
MWWCVKQTESREVHVYPFDERHKHVLENGSCSCLPEVKQTTAGSLRVIVHKKIGPSIKVRRKAHWIPGVP